MKIAGIRTFFIITSLHLIPFESKGQIDESQAGAWYMYFWNTSLGESNLGFQGDIQSRNWNFAGDLEQLLLRGGVTCSPGNTSAKFTLGYGYILSGEFGDGRNTSQESRIYQEALLPQKVGGRIFLTHRFRYEQRFVENQDLRTRYRYNLILNIPFNRREIQQGTLYFAFYNELFINGQRQIGKGGSVEIFDRNRTYGAIGYGIRDGLNVQAGVMRQITDTWGKTQVQLGLHHTF